VAVEDDTDPERKWKRLLLIFPVPMDNPIFSEPDQKGNTTVDCIINPSGYKYNRFHLNSTTVVWILAFYNTRRKVNKSKKETALEKLFKRAASIKDRGEKSASDSDSDSDSDGGGVVRSTNGSKYIVRMSADPSKRLPLPLPMRRKAPVPTPFD
jgi:hypothetical protein